MRNSCITYRAGSRVAVLHEDLLEVCDGNMLAAMLLSILIYWTDVKIAHHQQEQERRKAKGEEPEEASLWIWKSQEGFQHDLMNDKDGMRKVHRTTIASALKLIQDKGFIKVRRNPQNNIDQTRQYLVDQESVQKAIGALPNCIKADNRMSEIMQSNVGNHAMDSTKTDNALTNFRQAIPKITTKDYSTETTEQKSNTPPPQNRARDNLSIITPSPLPKKPDPVSPLTVPICLALADHYRGYLLTNGNHGAIEKEAIAIVRRGITYERLDRVYRYMKGLDKQEDGSGLYDEYWEDKTFDLSHVNKHLDAKEKEIKKKEAARKPGASTNKKEDKYIAHIRKKAAEVVEEGVLT